jgi:hypothetical protein
MQQEKRLKPAHHQVGRLATSVDNVNQHKKHSMKSKEEQFKDSMRGGGRIKKKDYKSGKMGGRFVRRAIF